MSDPTAQLQNLPPRDGDAPLHELSLDQLSVFLYVTFTGDELLELLRGIGAALKGGYRLESLSDAERADVLAGELRDYPKLRKKVIEKLAELYEFPALEGVVLPALVAEEISALAVQHDATVRMIWRLIADPSPEIRKTASIALNILVEDYYGPPPGKEGSPAQPAAAAAAVVPASGAAPGTAAPVDPNLKELKKEARRAGAMAERAREKATSLKEQLREARAAISQLEREANSKTKESARLGAELERVKEKLAEARKKKGHDEFDRVDKERVELKERVATLEEKTRTLAEERSRLEEQLESATKQPRPNEPARVSHADSQEPAVEELPATWLFPRFTREFYDSLDGWEPRIQRTAFKQAFLLAENHRHPSLRAIPLEGVPGYYRVRIATDVRLIYRRSENEREVEILSLIDREDLDRYVRQAKTR